MRKLTPKILIEPLMRKEVKIPPIEIEVYCFNGKAKIIRKIHNDIPNKLSIYDETLNNINLRFLDKEFLVKEKADNFISQAIELSCKLAKEFNFVRVDWLVFDEKIYFNEMTFTPYSGFISFDKNWNKKMGSWIKLGR